MRAAPEHTATCLRGHSARRAGASVPGSYPGRSEPAEARRTGTGWQRPLRQTFDDTGCTPDMWLSALLKIECSTRCRTNRRVPSEIQCRGERAQAHDCQIAGKQGAAAFSLRAKPTTTPRFTLNFYPAHLGEPDLRRLHPPRN